MKDHYSSWRSRFLAVILLIDCLMIPAGVKALTVAEVVKDLACPCQCPLILEDCNMTCGLEWKEEVGQLVKSGMNKAEIMEYFIDKYGEDARLTTMQRIEGKVFQYTRSFDTVDWALLWAGVTGWASLVFCGVYFGMRFFLNRRQNRENSSFDSAL